MCLVMMIIHDENQHKQPKRCPPTSWTAPLEPPLASSRLHKSDIFFEWLIITPSSFMLSRRLTGCERSDPGLVSLNWHHILCMLPTRGESVQCPAMCCVSEGGFRGVCIRTTNASRLFILLSGRSHCCCINGPFRQSVLMLCCWHRSAD